MIAIIDYGMGNLRSVQKAFEFLGYEAVITDSADVIARASHVILPGVGAFEDAMNRIRETGLDQALLAAVNAGKPILGICLGMQMMFEFSEENGRFEGLGIFPGIVTRFEERGPREGASPTNESDCSQSPSVASTGRSEGAKPSGDGRALKVPHMGWNTLQTRTCPLFDADEDPCVYFVHSYCMADVSDEWTAATCTYGQTFTAAICRGNVMATQFHPEKSGEAGLRMLKRFAEWRGVSC